MSQVLLCAPSAVNGGAEEGGCGGAAIGASTGEADHGGDPGCIVVRCVTDAPPRRLFYSVVPGDDLGLAAGDDG